MSSLILASVASACSVAVARRCPSLDGWLVWLMITISLAVGILIRREIERITK